jgi:hypothetical protein
MGYQVRVTKTAVLDDSADRVERVAVKVLSRFVSPPSWRRTGDGFSFWFYGADADGCSGSVTLCALPGGHRTTLKLGLELHVTAGNRVEKMLNRVGLGLQATRIVAEIAQSTHPANGAIAGQAPLTP